MIKISDKKECCGCSACYTRCPKHCISMEEDEEGFLYPRVDLNICINCGLCEYVCPCLHKGTQKKPLSTYAVKHPSEEIRLKSSSGGAFSLLAEKVIEKGGVVFAAKFDEQWNVVHGSADHLDELDAFRMSKYVQSRIGETFQQAENFFKIGRIVLFVGTPCQIHGLKLFLRKEYDNLLAVDFVCHGVPSPKVWRHYLEKIVASATKKHFHSSLSPSVSKQSGLIRSIQFRNKTYGWKKSSFVLHFNFTGPSSDSEKNPVSSSAIHLKPIRQTLLQNTYFRGFIHDIYLRPSCYVCCHKGFSNDSDMTLGDFWGIDKTYPKIFDNKGVTVLTINSMKGRFYYDDFSINGIEVDFNKALASNPSFYKAVEVHRFRKIFFMFYKVIPFNQLIIGIQIVNKICRDFLKLK